MKTKKQNIIFVAGLHGNEQMPVRALKENNIHFVLGNPLAQKKNIRFITRDLNSSFGIQGSDYEARRVRAILKEIDINDMVVDFHTTMAKTPPFVIVVDRKMIHFAATTGLRRVVLMKHNIKRGHALIDYRRGISIEAGNHKSRKSYRTTLQIVKNVLAKRKCPISLYEVYGKITKPGHYQNFKKHVDGFIPILAGEKAYNFYGLKARLVL